MSAFRQNPSGQRPPGDLAGKARGNVAVHSTDKSWTEDRAAKRRCRREPQPLGSLVSLVPVVQRPKAVYIPQRKVGAPAALLTNLAANGASALLVITFGLIFPRVLLEDRS